jgi:hypothetical protein
MILRSEPGTTGEWTVVAVGDAVLASPQAAAVDDLAVRLAGPDGFRAALETLVRDGIAAAPDFALIDAQDGVVRVVLRGAAELEAGAERISGSGVTTWTERVLEGVGELRLHVPGSTWALGIAGAPSAAPAPAPATVPVVAVAMEPAAEPEAVAEIAEPEPEPVAAPEPVAEPEPEVPHVTLAPPADDPELPAAEPVPAPGPVPAPDTDYAFLFGDTVYRTAGGADVRIPNPDPERPGDHDGRTVLVEELEAHEQGELPAAPVAAGPVLHLVLPDGATEPLTTPVLVGRSPSDPGHDASGGIPRLVTIASGDKDISRTHARVEVAGGAIVVTDLDSKNGTSVTMPGAAPRRLRAGEPAVVLPDTVIDLGGGVTMTVREAT